MLDPDRRDTEPTEPTPKGAAPTRSSVLQSPSLFVASLVDTLRRGASDNAQACAEHLSRHGALTGDEFCALVDTLPHPSQTSQLVWAYSNLTTASLDADFAEGLPAFLKIIHKCLVDCSEVERTTARRIARVLDRLLNARIASDDVGDRTDVVVGDAERCLLRSIASVARQDRPGYWECLELLNAVFPDTDSLECLFLAVDRIPGPHPKEALLGFQRSVAAGGSAEFVTTFEFVARALGCSERPGDIALRRSAAAGLAFHVEHYTDELADFMESDDDNFVRLACSVCGVLGREMDRELPIEFREELADRLKVIRARYRDDPPSSPLVDDALVALALVSPRVGDIDDVGRVVLERLRGNDRVNSELHRAYAEGLARVGEVEGVVALKPLSLRRFALLDSAAVVKRSLDRGARVATGQETDDDFELLALDIAGCSRLEDVLESCGEQEHLLDPCRLSARRGDSLSLFVDSSQAVQFARHHASLSLDGPVEFAAVLLPELLSAMVYCRGAEKKVVGEAIGEFALYSLTSLAKFAATDPKFRDVAVARLSSADWDLLSRLHKMNEKVFPRHYPEIGLAGLALRSVLDDDTSWQGELLAWWKTIDDKARDRMDPNALAFLAVVAERHQPGTVWQLLRKVSLVEDPGRAYSEIGMGLLARPEDSVSRICGDILSHRGEDLGRSLLLAQLMSRHATQAQRAHLLRATKELLDEPGVLGLDAATTLGALSLDRADALLLLEREPVVGIDDKVYRISCAAAAARILRNIERGTGR